MPPSKPYGPRIKLTWTKPVTPNGIIRSYTLFYSHGGDVLKEISGIDALNYTIGVLGGVVYELYVRAVTVKPGPNITINLTTREYGTFDSIYDTDTSKTKLCLVIMVISSTKNYHHFSHDTITSEVHFDVSSACHLSLSGNEGDNYATTYVGWCSVNHNFRISHHYCFAEFFLWPFSYPMTCFSSALGISLPLPPLMLYEEVFMDCIFNIAREAF